MTEKCSFQDEFGFTPVGPGFPEAQRLERVIVAQRLRHLSDVCDDAKKQLENLLGCMGESTNLLDLHRRATVAEKSLIMHREALAEAKALAKEAGFTS